MATPSVTVIVVHRERFSFAAQSLESIYAHTDTPFSLIYVDAGSPPRVARYLKEQASRKGFTLIRVDEYLTPNQARNLAIRQASTEYVVFIDNDVVVTPGWLGALVSCAVKTGAWIVGPLYLEGDPAAGVIHGTGRKARIAVENGARVLQEENEEKGQKLGELTTPLQDGPCDLVEFHCMLVRRDVFARLGGLDELLLSEFEHYDLCLAVQQAGGSIHFEPAAVVSYVPPKRLTWSDLRYFLLRWNEAWNQASARRFCTKWSLSPQAASIQRAHVGGTLHRRRAIPLRHILYLACGRRVGKWIDRRILFPLEEAANRRIAPWLAARYWRGLLPAGEAAVNP
jgi:GT2 family glycosyltransferase